MLLIANQNNLRRIILLKETSARGRDIIALIYC